MQFFLCTIRTIADNNLIAIKKCFKVIPMIMNLSYIQYHHAININPLIITITEQIKMPYF